MALFKVSPFEIAVKTSLVYSGKVFISTYEKEFFPPCRKSLTTALKTRAYVEKKYTYRSSCCPKKYKNEHKKNNKKCGVMNGSGVFLVEF